MIYAFATFVGASYILYTGFEMYNYLVGNPTEEKAYLPWIHFSIFFLVFCGTELFWRRFKKIRRDIWPENEDSLPNMSFEEF